VGWFSLLLTHREQKGGSCSHQRCFRGSKALRSSYCEDEEACRALHPYWEKHHLHQHFHCNIEENLHFLLILRLYLVFKGHSQMPLEGFEQQEFSFDSLLEQREPRAKPLSICCPRCCSHCCYYGGSLLIMLKNHYSALHHLEDLNCYSYLHC